MCVHVSVCVYVCSMFVCACCVCVYALCVCVLRVCVCVSLVSVYVNIYSWECYGEHGHHWDYTSVSSSLERCPDFRAC